MEKADRGLDRALLRQIARRAMLEKGLVPDFPPGALSELALILAPAAKAVAGTRDYSGLPWCSIDNDDSRDLDQLTVAEPTPDGGARILVAIADVDALVKKGTALDEHARANTTSVYTVAETFPMLPERLSTDLSSLCPGAERLAVVVDMAFSAEGELRSSTLCEAAVRNRAQLTYEGVGSWLESGGSAPRGISAVAGLEGSLRLQDRVAASLKSLRHENGALDLETREARPVFVGDELKDLELEKGNRAKDIIAEFMIAANGVAARYLASKGIPSLRRVVRIPKRWDRIVAIAAERGAVLPAEPDSASLERFLAAARAADPGGFPDLSLSVIKLLGRGEYVVQPPGKESEGHFGLAVKDYAHSTAPNRRYPDLTVQRLIKAAIAALPSPYKDEELQAIAERCTEKEDASNKVERQVEKSAAALLLEDRIGELFEAVVTGASGKGTWVRILSLPIEGRLESGFEGLDVGQALRVELLGVDVERGYIDFKRAELHPE
jgi:exoribonuclease-2